MLDSRKYCPQCGSDQLKYQVPKSILRGLIGLLLVVTMLATPAFLIARLFKPLPAMDLARLFFVFVVVLAVLIIIVVLLAIMSANRTKVYRWKCQQCGYQWTITREEWLQAGSTPVRTKTLSPQEQQEKKAVVEKLINQIKKT